MQQTQQITHSSETLLHWSSDQFYAHMRTHWYQGEHIALVGPTGTGKTSVASSLVGIREWCVMLAVKRYDDTIDKFKRAGFKVIKKWPPHFTEKHVILWVKPDSLDALPKQQATLAQALQSIYVSGGWCIYFDEAGYIAGVLGLGQYLGILLNQGRSSHISVVCSMTRPHSMVARIPAESLNQCRHVLIFKYTDEREIKACAEICGVNWRSMQAMQHTLGKYDFLYFAKDGTRAVVRM